MHLSNGQCVNLACLWEVTARKAGNVHRGRDFAGLHFTDFLASAAAIAPVFERADRQSVGATALQAIQATRALVSTNTNLGIVLLLAPLAAVPRSQFLRSGVEAILAALDIEDTRQVFAAIRLAEPGGLGKVAAEDVAAEPTMPLRAVMALAAERDLVARQYANGFQEVFDVGVPALMVACTRLGNLEDAIVFTQLTLLAQFPDSLILRKRGPHEADQARFLARVVLDRGWPNTHSGQAAFADFDTWLCDGRNPGTSADLVTACLYAVLRDNRLPWMPFRRAVPAARR